MGKDNINAPGRSNKKRVVIVGGGFAGLKIARKLDSKLFQVFFIDKKNYYLFQPLLYQVATAGIEPSAISFPFRKIFRKHTDFHIRICNATQVIPEKNLLETSVGFLEYDYLVVATGCSTNYFGNDHLVNDTMALKTTAEALYNRNQIIESFENALNTDDQQKRRELLTFVLVGGGATGVELSGALAGMKKSILPKDYPDLDISQMRIILVDGSPRLLSSFSETSSKEVERRLKKMGVELRQNCKVKDYKENVIYFDDGSTLSTANVFWVGGVAANSLPGFPDTCYGHAHRLNVNLYNQVNGYDNIFAIGDTALMVTEDHPKGHPQVVQPAMQQGKLLAANLKRMEKGESLKPFKYFDKGNMATIGRNDAVAEIGKLKFHGVIAWLMWLFVHLMYILGVKNKLFIFMDWTWSYLRYDPSLRLLIKPVENKPENDEQSKDTADTKA